MSEQLTQRRQKPRFSVAITTPQYQALVNNTLKDPDRARRFIASITSAVAVNPALQECDAGTILAGALLGESLNLSPSPQLGQYYLVPFNVRMKGPDGRAVKDESGQYITEKRAQFVLGYKGYIQLAIRSGQYRKLNVIEIKEGELQHFDPLNEDIDCVLIEDYDTREKAPTIGYYAMFEYTNGFRKAVYWSRQKMTAHADKYSPAFNAGTYLKILNGEIQDKDMWKYSSFWYKDFDDMAKKTLLRHIISRWGIMSIDLQTAFEQDNSMMTVNDTGGLAPLTPGDADPILPDLMRPDNEGPEEPEPSGMGEPEQVSMDEL